MGKIAGTASGSAHRQQGARSEAAAVRWNDLICVNDTVANWVAFFLILFKMINIHFII